MAPSNPKCDKCGESTQDRLIKCSECEEAVLCVPCIHPSLKGKQNLGLILSTLAKSDLISLEFGCAKCQEKTGEDSTDGKDDSSTSTTTKRRLNSIESTVKQMEKTLGSFMKSLKSPSCGPFSPSQTPSEQEASSSRPKYSEIAARNVPVPPKFSREFKKAFSDFQTEREISQEVVISGIVEKHSDFCRDHEAASKLVSEIAATIGMPVSNPDIRRVGKQRLKPDGSIDNEDEDSPPPRLVIWNLGSAHRQQEVLRNKGKLKTHKLFYDMTFIRAALPASKLASLPILRDSCKRMNSNENGTTEYDTWTVKYGIRNGILRKFQKTSASEAWGRGVDVSKDKIPPPPPGPT